MGTKPDGRPGAQLDDATVTGIIRVRQDQAADLTLFQNQAARRAARSRGRRPGRRAGQPGRRPAAPDEFYDRIAEAARSCGLAAELSSARWRKPCAEAYPAPGLLARFHHYGVPITASDGHQLSEVSWRISDLTAMARGVSYCEVSAFRSRSRTPQPL
jgi:hypothetical protein